MVAVGIEGHVLCRFALFSKILDLRHIIGTDHLDNEFAARG